MKKKLALLALSMAFSMSAFAAESDLSASQKIAAIEKALYGTEQAGALVARMDSLESDVYGSASNDSVIGRIDNLYAYIAGPSTAGQANFETRLNVVDWKLSDKMSGDPAKTRIENIEKLMHGNAQSGSISARLGELERLAGFNGSSIPVQETILPMDSVMKIRFETEMSTKTNRKGDTVNFTSSDNLYVNDVLVIPKGAHGLATISKVSQPAIFGQDGRIELEFTHVEAIDGTKIPLYVGELAKQKATSVAGAAGAAIGSMVILGPVGLVGGAFVKGASVNIPVGSETFVQTKAETKINGVVHNN